MVETDFAGALVGFENHGGRTTLGACPPLGRVRRGCGNNGRDHLEGARYRNCLGTYMHGSLLPKTPRLTDCLLEAALRRHDPAARLEPLDDSLEQRAHAAMLAKA